MRAKSEGKRREALDGKTVRGVGRKKQRETLERKWGEALEGKNDERR